MTEVLTTEKDWAGEWTVSQTAIVFGDLFCNLQLRVYPFASDSRLVVVIRFSGVKRSATCFSILFGVEFTCNYARAVSSVVRALASHARGHWFKSSTAHHTVR